jgi:hypothetical protein
VKGPITFVRDGRRFSARIDSFPRSPRDDPPSVAWWFVSIDEGPERRVMEAEPDDAPGEELYERLVAAVIRAEAKELEG